MEETKQPIAIEYRHDSSCAALEALETHIFEKEKRRLGDFDGALFVRGSLTYVRALKASGMVRQTEIRQGDVTITGVLWYGVTGTVTVIPSRDVTPGVLDVYGLGGWVDQPKASPLYRLVEKP